MTFKALRFNRVAGQFSTIIECSFGGKPKQNAVRNEKQMDLKSTCSWLVGVSYNNYYSPRGAF